MAEIAYEAVQKIYPDGTQAVHDLNLEIEDGELMVLVGPSGCGKTTALRMLAGLEEISDGEIRIGDVVVNDLTPKERDIAMVFQSYALYPHMSVYDNLAFGLKLHKVPKNEIKDRVNRAAKILQIEDFLKRKPRALSGGQRQRVAMGRAIVREPQAYLMDEPLSNLDAKLRVQMRAEIHQLQRRLGVTTIYVTHDQVEAMTMGDRVAVMRKGELQQVATPQDLYDRPVNLFVGGFIGSPAMNLLDGAIERDGDRLAVELGSQRLVLDSSVPRALAGYVGRRVIVGIRPEGLEDATVEHDGGEEQQLTARVELREALGSEIVLHLRVDAAPARTDETRELARDIGDERAALGVGADDAGATVVARVDRRSEAKEGDEVRLVVDSDALHFFDAETSLGIAD